MPAIAEAPSDIPCRVDASGAVVASTSRHRRIDGTGPTPRARCCEVWVNSQSSDIAGARLCVGSIQARPVRPSPPRSMLAQSRLTQENPAAATVPTSRVSASRGNRSDTPATTVGNPAHTAPAIRASARERRKAGVAIGAMAANARWTATGMSGRGTLLSEAYRGE